MILHLIQAAGPAFPTLPGKEHDAVLFLFDEFEITRTTTTTMDSFQEARSNIARADQVIVTHDWDPYAYIELGIAIELQKKIVVLNDLELIECGLFPKYIDFTYEISSEKTVIDYLTNMSNRNK